MKAVMWSKPGCPFCVMAEELLNKKGYQIDERKIGAKKISKTQRS